MKFSKFIALSALVYAAHSQATTVTFDDLNTRDNFGNLGISNTYQGFQWSSSGASNAGWAVATTTNRVYREQVTPVSGAGYAWNWGGVRSMYIDFGAAEDVAGAYFSGIYTFGQSSNTIQMFGYDSSHHLVANSSILNLIDGFNYLTAGFSNVYSIEIRSDRASSWFLADDIQLTASNNVPEPSSIALLGLGLAGLAMMRRRKV